MIKAVAKRILEKLHLFELERRLGWLDRQIARSYLHQWQVRKLHVGCGRNLLSGWLNADAMPLSRKTLLMDATRPFCFEDDTFDYIFCEHMIEHISYQHGLNMLAECRRVLKTSGKIRISTPDLAFVIGLYQGDKSPLEWEYIRWANRTFVHGVAEDNRGFVINNLMRNWGHTFLYDENTLTGAMESVGFTNVVKCDLQESKDAALCNLENEARVPAGFLRMETFTLEGTKSGDKAVHQRA
jgi:predicted SAM-dependent methyltransferase